MLKLNMFKGDIMEFLGVDRGEFMLVRQGGGIAPHGSHVTVTEPAESYLGALTTRHEGDLADIYTVTVRGYNPRTFALDCAEVQRGTVEVLL